MKHLDTTGPFARGDRTVKRLGHAVAVLGRIARGG